MNPCHGCGACCSSQGTPPGFAIFFPIDGKIPDWALESDDYYRLITAPPEAVGLLAKYYLAGQGGGPEFDRYDRGLPCLWYDVENTVCRWHTHRPEACREFEFGGLDCNQMRSSISLPMAESNHMGG